MNRVPTSEEIAELVEAWKRRLSHDDGIWQLRKGGGIRGWYHQLATVPEVARAVATELARDSHFAVEVEHLHEYLDALELPADARPDRLSALELDGPSDFREAAAFCELAEEHVLRFEAWLGRAREIEHGTRARTDSPFAVGTQVEHPTFGRGVVRARDGETITVAFDGGDKRMRSRFLKPLP